VTEASKSLPKHWGWSYHYALDTLDAAYKSAGLAAKAAQKKLDETYIDYEAQYAGGAPEGEDATDWQHSMAAWSERMSEDWQEAHDVLRLVTEAFTIALFHLWERQVKGVMDVTRYNHEQVFAFLSENGLTVNEYDIHSLELTANTLKHSEGRSAKDLYAADVGMFDIRIAPSEEYASYESLRVTHDHFQRFIAAVRSSGPTDRKMGF
jgi:hypothetical protein